MKLEKGTGEFLKGIYLILDVSVCHFFRLECFFHVDLNFKFRHVVLATTFDYHCIVCQLIFCKLRLTFLIYFDVFYIPLLTFYALQRIFIIDMFLFATKRHF